MFGHVTARNRPWPVRNGAKIRVHQTSWTDPARCRGDVTCVCLQACEHARHVLSETARPGRGEERSGERRIEVAGEVRRLDRNRQVGPVGGPPRGARTSKRG